VSRQDWLALVAAVIASATLSLAQRQDLNFDQLQYHFYLGWSLLAGRLDIDVAPAGGGTYLNPVLHVPSYLGIRYLPPRAFGALLGAVHGVNLFLVYLIALRILPPGRRRRALAALAAVMAGVGPAAVSLAGTTFGDNLVSIPMLASVLVLAGAVESADRQRVGARPRLPLRLVALSAALAGAAAGLKLTFVLFLASLALVALGLAVWARSWRVAVVFGTASAFGFVLVAGYWGFQMWTHFSNPFFPFDSALFDSPYRVSSTTRDLRWASHGWSDPLVEAVHMATGRTEGLQEIPYADSRYLCLLWLAALLTVSRILGRRAAVMPVAARAVVLYWTGCYVIWIAAVHYYRYFAVGEFLAPAALLALLACQLRRGLLAVWLALVLAVGAGSDTGSWYRIAWGRNWYRVRFASPPEPGAAVMVDGVTASFVLPYFPEGTRFFGVVQGGFAPLHALVTDRLRAHRGPVYRLRVDSRPASPLESFGLADTDDCGAVRTRGIQLVLCRLERARGFP
jgi:hypothetical protein